MWKSETFKQSINLCKFLTENDLEKKDIIIVDSGREYTLFYWKYRS